jgi:hypothetical protein
MAFWLEKDWKPLIKSSLNHFFCSRGFFTFLFEFKEHKDLIFCNGPYFVGARGVYLNKWTPDFNQENNVPSAVVMWVHMPHLPLHCWSNDTLRNIGNSIGQYIDKVELKENLLYHAKFFIEVDLEKGILEAMIISLDNWLHI